MIGTAVVIASTFVAKELLKYVIKDVGIKAVLKWIAQPYYKKQLANVAHATMLEFANKYPPKSADRGKRQFYFSGEILAQMLKFIYFSDGLNIDFSRIAGRQDIVQPTQEQIQEFIELFDRYLRANRALKELYLDENYKERVFLIHQDLQKISEDIEKIGDDVKKLTKIIVPEISLEKLTEALRRQTGNQIEKQILSGKYIPDTFIESSELKDYLRYMCLPSVFVRKAFVDIKRLDFRYLNLHLEKTAQPLFEFDVAPFETDVEIQSEHPSLLAKLEDYLKERGEWIQNHKISNISWSFERKVGDAKQSLEPFNKQFILITENAGQGKTNLVCDFAQRVLLKRDQLVTFLIGNEVNSTDIEKTIIKKLFPHEDRYSFKALCEDVAKLCSKMNCHWTIIIDGINENSDSKVFGQTVEQFLEGCRQYSFIKVILTCRTEYFQNNFKNIEIASFRSHLKIFKDYSRDFSDQSKDKLLKSYMHHFNVRATFSEESEKQLTENFLLLRFFAETYQGQSIEAYDIYKAELFDTYFKKKCKEIEARDASGESVVTRIKVRMFLLRIVEQMVINRQFVNIPLDQIISKDEPRDAYVRFIDENILVRRDISIAGSIFTETEVVNFTFDEFRDFVISDYLIADLYPKDPAAFTEFITDFLNERSLIREGVCTFLLLIAKRRNLKELFPLLAKTTWFEKTFIRSIFSLRDNEVSAEDIALLKKLFAQSTSYAHSIVLRLTYGARYNVDIYPNLNIAILFDLFDSLDDRQMNEFFYSIYQDKRELDETHAAYLCEFLSKEVEDPDVKDLAKYASLFNLLVYLLPVSCEASSVFEQFHHREKIKGDEYIRRALKSSSKRLVESINKYLERYEINI